ncbi:hypothetical protein BN381_10290 [Candidatus Microthrix parvicella RN1]|uniref:Uncharacterized protein n=1 Tax=Candidatus Neomicrothrix parvicella RN1 TaxID=1229780 RepID=R4YVL7_9ACTN|nr:hypothetical protein BN381_10290 [Candidatus Microthrix parvicella RN1]
MGWGAGRLAGGRVPQWSPGLMAGGRGIATWTVVYGRRPQWSPGLMAGGRSCGVAGQRREVEGRNGAPA